MLTGGASRNPVWSQLRADVLGRPVELPANPSRPLGMAVLAGPPSRRATSLVGTSALTDAVGQMVRVDRVVEHRDAVERGPRDGVPPASSTVLGERGWLGPGPSTRCRRAAGVAR